MLFQAMSAKLGIVTGRNLAELVRDQFPRRVAGRNVDCIGSRRDSQPMSPSSSAAR